MGMVLCRVVVVVSMCCPNADLCLYSIRWDVSHLHGAGACFWVLCQNTSLCWAAKLLYSTAGCDNEIV